jgi:hypothetical protein
MVSVASVEIFRLDYQSSITNQERSEAKNKINVKAAGEGPPYTLLLCAGFALDFYSGS